MTKRWSTDSNSQPSHGLRRRAAGPVYFTLLLAVAALALAAPATAQEPGNITGQVTDATAGTPLGEVQVYLAGAGLGTLSRQDGRYLLVNVPAGTYEMRAERIGMSTVSAQVTVTAGETVVQDFTLSSEALGLDEIIVTGTAGGQQRRAVANVVGTLEVSAQIEEIAPASFQQLLAGQVAGVGVQIGGGNVGTGGNVLIRGIGTLTQGSSTRQANTGPLVYVDGVRINADNRAGPSSGAGTSRLNDINPEEIERIEVIKGPAAATLYGTEASNGVIQIITRKGQTGRPVVSLTVRQGGNWFKTRTGASRPTTAWSAGGSSARTCTPRKSPPAGRCSAPDTSRTTT